MSSGAKPEVAIKISGGNIISQQYNHYKVFRSRMLHFENFTSGPEISLFFVFQNVILSAKDLRNDLR